MNRAVLVVAVAAAILVGCGSNPTATAETPYDFSFTDAAGDTAVAAENPDSVKATDLIKVSGTVDGDHVLITLDFAEPVRPWTDEAANSLDGFVYLDVDQVASTGLSVPSREFGADFYLDLRDNGSGKVGLVDWIKKSLTLVPITFNGTSIQIDIARPLLATVSDSDNKLNLFVEIGSRHRTPSVDFAPDSLFSVLPPPTSP